MFEEPPTKRVRREEVFEASPSPKSRSTSPALHNAESTEPRQFDSTLRYEFQYDLIAPSINEEQKAQQSNVIQEQPQTEEEDGLEFRLFATTQKSVQSSVQPVQKIRIRSPTPIGTNDGGGFVNPHRRRGYYFTFDHDGVHDGMTEDWEQRKVQFQSVAINGNDILKLAKTQWYGTALPWKVIHITGSKSNIDTKSRVDVPVEPTVKRRTRPGKKRRIILRKREVGKEEAERAEREKRARRNREKKLKKRARDKLKKQAERVEGDDIDGLDGNDIDVDMGEVNADADADHVGDASMVRDIKD